jgi:CRP-like cAMP-binding protein
MTYLANLAYVLMLLAFLTRDVLYLRGLLVVAQGLVVVYTWRAGVPVIAVWNVLFVSINAWMALQVLRERRAVTLPADLQALHERHFSALTPQEFLDWWRKGRRETLGPQRLTAAGARPDWLYFLLAGTVRVSREGTTLVELPAGYFVAEMSLLTDQPANADVEAAGPVEVMRWATTDLRDLRARKPAMWTKIQSVIGLDLVEKIHLQERRAGRGE